MTTIRCLTFAAALTLPLAAGCGKQAMVPAQGKVTYRGYPVNNGIIVFTPETRGPLAVGRIREDGSYVLYTGDNPGAYPGRYQITVASLAAGSSTEAGSRYEFPRSAIPPQFREFAQSGRYVDIKPNQSNDVPVPLTD